MVTTSENTAPAFRAVIVCGPTGAGKTRAAVALALRADSEIISADSIQVYRGLDVGSAKPTVEERGAVRHHLIDVVRPDEPMTAALYAERALEAACDIRRRGKTVVVAGGTGLYIKAFVHGLVDTPPADDGLRRRFSAVEEREGAGALHRRLRRVDPEAADQLHPADLVRVTRALEVHALTGKPISELQRDHAFRTSRFEARYVGLDPGPKALDEKIEARVREMMAAGLLDEVRRLLAAGYGPELRALQSPGYRQMVAFLRSEMTLEEAAASICRDHRRYARRQRVWFRAVPGVVWHPGPDDLDYDGLAGWLRGTQSAARR